MIRLAIQSHDARLTSLLTSALKSAYSIQADVHAQHLQSTPKAPSNVDVLLLDFDSSMPLDWQVQAFDALPETEVPIIVMTDAVGREAAMEFLRRGAFDCLRKPPSLIELKVIIERAHEHAMMKRELKRRKENPAWNASCDQLIGSSDKAVAVYDLIRRVADLSVSVLITGESGTGKELVARAIHNTGPRAGQPFVAVSCGAIPESLIESELFGHERGAFTGSTGSRAGYFEQAGAGTLFLDEIGELSASTQVKLLRVLQQREFSRLGSNRLVPLNARVIFATHRDLRQMVRNGEFRQDLYYRVNVMNVSVPALRDRSEDIPTLALHFMRRYAAEYGREIDNITSSALDSLLDHDWPGNIRELEHVIQAAVVRADGSVIGRSDLPEFDPPPSGPVEVPECSTFERMLRQFKIDVVARALEDSRGNKTLAAQKLGLSRTYLHRLIRLGAEEHAALEESA